MVHLHNLTACCFQSEEVDKTSIKGKSKDSPVSAQKHLQNKLRVSRSLMSWKTPPTSPHCCWWGGKLRSKSIHVSLLWPTSLWIHMSVPVWMSVIHNLPNVLLNLVEIQCWCCVGTVKNALSSYSRNIFTYGCLSAELVPNSYIFNFSSLFLCNFKTFNIISPPTFNPALREGWSVPLYFFLFLPSILWALIFTSAQLLFCFALLAGHLLAAAVLQLFALVVVRSHFEQPAALYLDHLRAGERD